MKCEYCGKELKRKGKTLRAILPVGEEENESTRTKETV